MSIARNCVGLKGGRFHPSNSNPFGRSGSWNPFQQVAISGCRGFLTSGTTARLPALLDEAYQRSDQVYRNWTRFWAMVAAVFLALAGGWMMHPGPGYWSFKDPDLGEALLVGLLATPLAPIAKDLSSGLATAVNTLQLVKK
jgi:hypothetical protein